MKRPMKAITLWRPWSWAMTDADKRIENRSRPPSAFGLKVGDVFSLHAGKKYDTEDADALRDILEDSPLAKMIPEAAECPQGIVALARLSCVYEKGSLFAPFDRMPAGQMKWFFGPFGYLCDVLPVVPVPCKGERGGWPVPDEIVKQFRPREPARLVEFSRMLAVAGYLVESADSRPLVFTMESLAPGTPPELLITRSA